MKIEVQEITEDSGRLFNVNNLWDTGSSGSGSNGPPNNYSLVLRKTYTNKWIDSFHKDYHVIELSEKDLSWMAKAFGIGQITLEFPRLYSEEFESTLRRHSVKRKEIFDGTKYFVRSDICSLKYGKYGVGPYQDLGTVIKSMVTTICTHSCFRPNDKVCKLYFIKWNEQIHKDKEFRAFVYNNEITAVSQQDVLNVSPWIKENDKETIARNIITFFNTYVKPKMMSIMNYTLDIAITDDGPYFIEANSFGSQYAAASSLFHWIDDYALLRDSNTVTMRILI